MTPAPPLGACSGLQLSLQTHPFHPLPSPPKGPSFTHLAPHPHQLIGDDSRCCWGRGCVGDLPFPEPFTFPQPPRAWRLLSRNTCQSLGPLFSLENFLTWQPIPGGQAFPQDVPKVLPCSHKSACWRQYIPA